MTGTDSADPKPRYSLRIRRDGKARVRVELGDIRHRRAVGLPGDLLVHVPLPRAVGKAAKQLLEGFSTDRRDSSAHVAFDASDRLGVWLASGKATLEGLLSNAPNEHVWQAENLQGLELGDYTGGVSLKELKSCLSWGLHHYSERPMGSTRLVCWRCGGDRTRVRRPTSEAAKAIRNLSSTYPWKRAPRLRRYGEPEDPVSAPLDICLDASSLTELSEPDASAIEYLMELPEEEARLFRMPSHLPVRGTPVEAVPEAVLSQVTRFSDQVWLSLVVPAFPGLGGEFLPIDQAKPPYAFGTDERAQERWFIAWVSTEVPTSPLHMTRPFGCNSQGRCASRRCSAPKTWPAWLDYVGDTETTSTWRNALWARLGSPLSNFAMALFSRVFPSCGSDTKALTDSVQLSSEPSDSAPSCPAWFPPDRVGSRRGRDRLSDLLSPRSTTPRSCRVPLGACAPRSPCESRRAEDPCK